MAINFKKGKNPTDSGYRYCTVRITDVDLWALENHLNEHASQGWEIQEIYPDKVGVGARALMGYTIIYKMPLERIKNNNLTKYL